ncbi:MAG: DUF5946 family protein [Ktedonobacterales bacterium]
MYQRKPSLPCCRSSSPSEDAGSRSSRKTHPNDGTKYLRSTRRHLPPLSSLNKEVSPVSYCCPQCGAKYSTDETCEDRFNLGQAREMTDPASFAVHHLSVPCFMLQHNRYSHDGWIQVRQMLTRFLAGLTPDEARRDRRKAVDSGNRTYSFTKGPKLAGVESIAWTYTIADVRLDTAEHYCADVWAWAAQVVRDSEELMRTVGAETQKD